MGMGLSWVSPEETTKQEGSLYFSQFQVTSLGVEGKIGLRRLFDVSFFVTIGRR